MRTKTLRRWVVGLFVAAALGVCALSAAEIMYTTQDIIWSESVPVIPAPPSVD